MDKSIQDKAREKIVTEYLERGWDCLLNYNYWGKKFEKINAEIDEYRGRIEAFEVKIAEIAVSADSKTKESREKVRLLRKDIDQYNDRINSVGPVQAKFHDKATQWQERGCEMLELAEEARTFKVKTPEEIEADKKIVPAKPVVADVKS